MVGSDMTKSDTHIVIETIHEESSNMYLHIYIDILFWCDIALILDLSIVEYSTGLLMSLFVFNSFLFSLLPFLLLI